MSSHHFRWLWVIAAVSACGGSEFSSQPVTADAGSSDASADSAGKDASAGAAGASGSAGSTGGTGGAAGKGGAAGGPADAGCASPSDCDLGYACLAGACMTSCTDEQACSEGYYCSGDKCLPKLEPGVACAEGHECASSLCVDGVCCTSECAGKCMKCRPAASPTPGECTAISEGMDPDNECAGEKACDGNGACGGTWACDCATKLSDVHATCCGGEACGVCANEGGVCSAKNGTGCFQKNDVASGAIGPGSGIADTACPSGWRCAVWKCTCTY